MLSNKRLSKRHLRRQIARRVQKCLEDIQANNTNDINVVSCQSEHLSNMRSSEHCDNEFGEKSASSTNPSALKSESIHYATSLTPNFRNMQPLYKNKNLKHCNGEFAQERISYNRKALKSESATHSTFEAMSAKKTQVRCNSRQTKQNYEDAFWKYFKKWAFQNNVTHKGINELLALLSLFPKLPSTIKRDARTVLGTPKIAGIYKIKNGEMFYTQIEKTLKHRIDQKAYRFSSDLLQVIKLQFSIDGLPLYNSSVIQFWPILGCATNLSNKQPFSFNRKP